MTKIQSTCNYCSLACNMDFYVEDNKIVKVLPTKDYPVNKGFSCIKGLNLDKQNTMYRTMKKPLFMNGNGERVEIEWEDAFKMVAEKIKNTKEKYGPDSIAAISTGQLTLEEMALVGHVFRNYVGGNMDGNTRLCMATSVVAHKQSFGFDAPPYTLNDFELSDTIILIGSNPVVAHPVVWSRIRSNNEKVVITIDPRKSETAINSDFYYGIKPKSDLILLYTLSNLIIEKNWIDKDYIDKYSENFEGFKEHVKKYKLENVEELTGISAERVLELAELIHKGKRVSIWWTMGVNQGYQAVRTAQAIINLAVMTGNIGRPGTGPNSLTGQCNAMGSRLFSNTTGLYGGGDYDNEKRREAVAQALGVDSSIFPTKPTLPYNVIIEKIISGEIKALWILCTNPRHSWINNTQFAEAMKKLDFFIVQDIYDDTDSSLDCDLYLPVVSGIEKEGTIINTERRLSKLNPVLKKEEGTKNDYEVILEIGKALGMGKLLDGWETPRGAFNYMKATTKGMPCDITGIEYEDLSYSKGIQWPFPAGSVLVDNERRLFEENIYYTPNGKVKFIFEDVAKNPLSVTSEFPYVLNTGRGTVGQWHTQTRTREIPYVQGVISKKAYIYISKELANELKIKDEELITVSSINGQSRIFTAIITKTLPKDQLYAPLHYIETNSLTASIYDTYSKEPSYKYVPINISKTL
ncbi:molybdopterin oxidoreductase family protein [Cetobacterium sp. 2A]|uniref:molybdopterin oxidoreductase family protein n=1 Tax=Cetobacterium sp. 2A TaxID=2754723 RepID=UPI00163BF1FE|nr:molybdopterin oxidoreductase family protein [Cetobacterium sp. 2A]MBC2855135.1 molybdopterin oxidoreductase family protein [Cetobacterium sp. 2A]